MGEPTFNHLFSTISSYRYFQEHAFLCFPTHLDDDGPFHACPERLKEQGRLSRSFGKVTIRDQLPSNTIQKIIALKEAMALVENYPQNLNVCLLKIRTIFLAGQPEVTTQMALVLLASSAVLLVVPFKYVLAFFVFDLFTRELEFRREMVRAFMNFLKERWGSIHAAPVVVLPYEGTESSPKILPAKATEQAEPKDVQRGDSYVTSKNGINSS